MTVVQNQELTPTGGPAPNVKIDVRIGGVPAATSTLTGSVVAIAQTVSDANGNWSLDLTPNSLLRPVGTWYEIRRTYPSALGGLRTKQYAVVPQSVTPLNYESVIVSEPEAPRLTDSELNSHMAHTDPHEQYLSKPEADSLYIPLGSVVQTQAADILHTNVTDWNTATRSIRLDEFATPTQDLALGGKKIQAAGAPMNTSDVARLQEILDHEAKANDPHGLAGYGIMVGGGRRIWVQDSEPTGALVKQNDIWARTDGVIRIRGLAAWNAPAVTGGTAPSDNNTTTPTSPTSPTDVDSLANLNLAINHFFGRAVNASGAVVSFDESLSKVTSEGAAHAMEMAAIQGNQTRFDLVRGWANANLKRSLHNETNGPNLWANRFTLGTGVVDWNYLTGPEYTRVVALARACQLWNRQRDYDELSALAYDLKTFTLNTDEGRAYQVSDSFQKAITNGHHAFNGGVSFEVNVSYNNPLAYRLLKAFTNDPIWDQALAGHYDMLTKVTDGAGGLPTTVGLPPEWNDYNTASHDVGPITNGTGGWVYTRSTDYSYDAFRAVIRTAQDAILFKEPRAKAYLAGNFRTFAQNQWATADKFTDRYSHAGARLSTLQKLFFAHAGYFALKVTDPNDPTAASIKTNWLSTLLTTDASWTGPADQAKYFRSVPTGITPTPSYYGELWMILNEALEYGVFAQLATVPGIVGKYVAPGTTTGGGGTTTPTNPVPPGAVPLWTDPNSTAASYATSLPAGTKKTRFTWLASVPQTFWTGPEWDANANGVLQAVNDAKAKGQWLSIAAYGIPGRDLGGASAGGSAGATEYRSWSGAVVTNIGTANAIVIIEPDAIAQMVQAVQNGSKTQADFDARMALIAEFVQKLRTNCPNARIYLDGAHQAWFPDPTLLVPGMVKAGVANCHGICGNVSNFRTDANTITWLKGFVGKFNMPHLGFIWDTGRNGKDPAPDGADWQNPLQTRFGRYPQFGGNTGDPQVHGWLYIKRPGESDGNDPGGGIGHHGGPSAGAWWPLYLYVDGVADNANGPTGGNLEGSGNAGMLQRPPTPGVNL